MNSNNNIAVVGAGIVGLSSALWLQQKGFRVTVVDPEPPGSGTSSGNACTIASYGCIPINSPSLWWRLPSLMMAGDSPLRVSLPYAASRPGWMLEFLANCRRSRVEQIIDALGGLLARSLEGLEPLLEQSGTRDQVEQRGLLQVFRDRREFAAYWPDNLKRREQGASLRELDAAEIIELEPNLKPIFSHGVLIDGVRQVLDPLALCQRYAESLQRAGGSLLQRRVTAISSQADGVRLELQDGESLQVRRVVVAAGAQAHRIDGVAGFMDKLDTERGYHVQYRDRQNLLSRPVSWHAAGFYAVPMALGLRLAGTVEIAGNEAPPNPRITERIARKGCAMLDLPARPDSSWLGFRPTFPDSLPVIGSAPGQPDILYACGHHHLGLTLAGITGKLIAELANGEQPSHNINPFRADRFR